MSSDSDADQEVISDVDSFATVEMNVSALNHLIEDMYNQAEELESHLLTMQKPLEGTQVKQLSFLEASPFRHATFKTKPHGFPGADPTHRYPFHEVCTMLRKYLIESGSVLSNGDVQLNAQLQALFGIKDTVIGYIALLGHLRHVLE